MRVFGRRRSLNQAYLQRLRRIHRTLVCRLRRNVKTNKIVHCYPVSFTTRAKGARDDHRKSSSRRVFPHLGLLLHETNPPRNKALLDHVCRIVSQGGKMRPSYQGDRGLPLDVRLCIHLSCMLQADLPFGRWRDAILLSMVRSLHYVGGVGVGSCGCRRCGWFRRNWWWSTVQREANKRKALPSNCEYVLKVWMTLDGCDTPVKPKAEERLKPLRE